MATLQASAEPVQSGEQQQDVWLELFTTVQNLSETMEHATQAFGSEPGDKAVSATTRKRLLIKALHGLRQSRDGIALLTEHLKALQVASQQWQRSMLYASKSHEELLEQLEGTSRELHATSERLRSSEAQRITGERELDTLRLRLEDADRERTALQQALKQREEELETAQFAATEAQTEMAHMNERMAGMQQAQTDAEAKAERAVAALDSVKAEASKATASANRHQQVVAKLTADNLVFLMNLKKAEADLAAANRDRANLRLAAEQQRGPWFEEVRAGVEEHVRVAMQRAEELEAELEAVKRQHEEQLQVLAGQRADLEEYLGEVRRHEAELQDKLTAATQAQQSAEAARVSAVGTAESLKQQLEAAAAEKKVLQENVKAMRQECTERWVQEQAALSRVSGLEAEIASLASSLQQCSARLQQLEAALEEQAAVKRQLMQRKEEVEWQLMTAMAKLEEGGHVQPRHKGPVPLNLMVSGLLQVGGKSQAAAPAMVTAEKPDVLEGQQHLQQHRTVLGQPTSSDLQQRQDLQQQQQQQRSPPQAVDHQARSSDSGSRSQVSAASEPLPAPQSRAQSVQVLQPSGYAADIRVPGTAQPYAPLPSAITQLRPMHIQPPALAAPTAPTQQQHLVHPLSPAQPSSYSAPIITDPSPAKAASVYATSSVSSDAGSMSTPAGSAKAYFSRLHVPRQHKNKGARDASNESSDAEGESSSRSGGQAKGAESAVSARSRLDGSASQQTELGRRQHRTQAVDEQGLRTDYGLQATADAAAGVQASAQQTSDDQGLLLASHRPVVQAQAEASQLRGPVAALLTSAAGPAAEHWQRRQLEQHGSPAHAAQSELGSPLGLSGQHAAVLLETDGPHSPFSLRRDAPSSVAASSPHRMDPQHPVLARLSPSSTPTVKTTAALDTAPVAISEASGTTGQELATQQQPQHQLQLGHVSVVRECQQSRHSSQQQQHLQQHRQQQQLAPRLAVSPDSNCMSAFDPTPSISAASHPPNWSAAMEHYSIAQQTEVLQAAPPYPPRSDSRQQAGTGLATEVSPRSDSIGLEGRDADQHDAAPAAANSAAVSAASATNDYGAGRWRQQTLGGEAETLALSMLTPSKRFSAAGIITTSAPSKPVPQSQL